MPLITDNSLPLIGKPAAQPKLVEVCRSFAYKLNLANHGGPQYESADFFASRKIKCAEEDAQWVSQQIFEECVQEVRESVAAFKATMQAKMQRRTA